MSVEKVSDAAAVSKTTTPMPMVVSFAYRNLQIDAKKNKWTAECKYCKPKMVIADSKGTTSGFTR